MYNEELIFDFCLPADELKEPLRVCVTGAGGQVAYSLLHSIANGDVFGQNQLITLLLHDNPSMVQEVKSVVAELQDCSFKLLHEINGTTDLKVAFNSIDVAILVASVPLLDNMDRADFIKANSKLYEEQGSALDRYAKKCVKVLVVGDPANTNCLVLSECAPSIPKTNFTCLTRLDQNRAVSQVALRLGVKIHAVKKVIIWGNCSSTKYPDLEHATVCLNCDDVPVKDVLSDNKWVEGNFIKIITSRDRALGKARTCCGGMSVAKAVCDHMVVWWLGMDASEKDFFSMGVLSDGSYNVPENLYFSYPVRLDPNGDYKIVQDLHLSEFSKEKLKITVEELIYERNLAIACLRT